METMFPFSCPVCARINEYPPTDLVEGAQLTCPFCACSLRLHGHMLEYVKKEIARLKEAPPAGGGQ
jgi:hypothetical protein